MGRWEFVHSLIRVQCHLRSFAWVTWCRLGHASAHRNSSQPSITSANGSTPSPRPAACATNTLEFDARNAAKDLFFFASWSYIGLSMTL